MNNQTKLGFKPGPYRLQLDEDGCEDVWNIYAAGADEPITGVTLWAEEPEWAARAESTARLFAAAPQLFDALRLADGYLNYIEGSKYAEGDICRSIQEALVTATGTIADSIFSSELRRAKRKPTATTENSRDGSIDAFGGCPHCRGNDGFLNVHSSHWFICKIHRTKWCVGSNWFRCWREETQADWEKNVQELSLYKEVQPIFE